MKRYSWILGIALVAGCRIESTDSTRPNAKSAVATQRKVEEFFVKWFKSHGHEDVVSDANGVGLAANPVRLKASLYGSNQNEDGCVVETEFRVRLAAGKEIVEFVAGVGKTEAEAIDDTLLNFTLTTYHVVYKAFLNDQDEHMDSEELTISGQPRAAVMGDIYMRGNASAQIDLNPMRPQLKAALEGLQLTSEPHWIKIVYSQNESKPMTVAVTLDNSEDQGLTKAITELDWPRSNDFYMAKQFVVIK